MHAAPSVPARVPSRRWRKLALALGVLVGALVAAELGLRLWLRIDGRPYSAWRMQQAIGRAVDQTRAFVPDRPDSEGPRTERPGPLLQPYFGAEAWHDPGDVLAYFREHADERDYKVVVVGGSVAASFAGTIRARLPEVLAGDPALAGRRVVVLNYAHAAYKQPQQVTKIVYLLSLGYRPDAVIDIDGFNEVGLAFENGKTGVNPVYPSPPVWAVAAVDLGVQSLRDVEILSRMLDTRARARSIAAQAERWHLVESAWLGRMTLARIGRLNDQFLVQQGELLSRPRPRTPGQILQANGPPFDARDEALMSTCVRCWVEGSMSLQELCAARGIRFVHVLQPTLHDIGSKIVSEEEATMPPPSPHWITGASTGYPRLRAKIPELRAQGVHFLDQSRVFAGVSETLYFDACHLNARGEQLWFERLAPDLRQALLGP